MAKYKQSVGWYILHLFEKGKCEREGKVIFLLALSCAQNKTAKSVMDRARHTEAFVSNTQTPVDTLMSCYWYIVAVWQPPRKAIVAFLSFVAFLTVIKRQQKAVVAFLAILSPYFF